MRTIGVVILAVLIVTVTSRIPRYQYKLSDGRGRMNPFDVRADSKEARGFLKPREPCNEVCYENCYEEARDNGKVANCYHCGSDC